MRNIFVLLITVLFISCDKSADMPVNPNNPMRFNLDNDSIIQLWCRCVFSFDALNNTNGWNIKSNDEKIATVINENSHFTIRTHQPGHTKLVITNGQFSKTISLISIGFSNYWKESQSLEIKYPNYLGIAVEDKDLYNSIKMDLKPIYLNRGIEYKFNNDGNLSVLIPSMGDPIKGLYNFNAATQTLTLDYKNTHEVFYCDIQPYTEKATIPRTTDRFIVALHQDLTEEYRHKYPTYRIDSVYIIRHIISLGSWWIATKTS